MFLSVHPRGTKTQCVPDILPGAFIHAFLNLRAALTVGSSGPCFMPEEWSSQRVYAAGQSHGKTQLADPRAILFPVWWKAGLMSFLSPLT